MITIKDLPVKIRGIRQPNWTDELNWIPTTMASFVTDVDHDWRLWVDASSGLAYVCNKGFGPTRPYDTLTEALASLDYKVDD